MMTFAALSLLICSLGITSAIPSAGVEATERPFWIADANQDDIVIPKHFDTRMQWYGCGMTVLDQGHCGSCWAVSATSNLGDRHCIHMSEEGKPIKDSGRGGSGTTSRMFQRAGKCVAPGDASRNHGCVRQIQFLSAQLLVSCGTITESDDYSKSGGCNGGESFDAFQYFHNTGLSVASADPTGQWTGETGGCTPYTSGKCTGKDPHSNGCKACSAVLDMCQDTGLPPQLYRVSEWGQITHDLPPRNYTGERRPPSKEMDRLVRAIQIEVMTNGPVHFNIDDYENFVRFFDDYPLGIYNNTEGGPKVGGHCMNIIGWGEDEESGLPYWLFKNTWGAKWGSEGIGRYVRGWDIGGIESFVYAGCPAGTNCKLTAGVNTTIMHSHDREHARVSSGKWIPADVNSSLVREAVATAVPVYQERYGNQTAIAEQGGALPDSIVLRAWTRSAGGAQVRLTVQLTDKSEKQLIHNFEAKVARVPGESNMRVLHMDNVGPNQ